MARPTLDPAGARKTVCVTLSPQHFVKLVNEATRLGTTRTAIVAALIEEMRYNPGVPISAGPGEEIRMDSDGARRITADGAEIPLECPHPATFPIAGGLKKCRNCEAVRGVDGTWRTR